MRSLPALAGEAQILAFTAAEQPTQEAIAGGLWRAGQLAYKLRPTQFELRQWWRSQSATFSVAHCARGYGKTYWFLSEAAEAGAKTHPLTRHLTRPARMVYAAPTREQARSIILPSAEVFFQDCPPDIRPRWHVDQHAYIWPNGSRLIIDGADDERGNHLRGPFADIVFADEQGFWRHCDYVTKTILLPQVQRVGGRIIGASTSPETTGHEFVGLCAEAQQEGAYIVRTIDDDTTLSDQERDKRMRDLAEEKHKGNPRMSTAVQREYLCMIVTEAERAVIPEFDQAFHVTARPSRPEWCDKYVAMDLGLVDYAHVLFGYYDFARAKIVIEDEHVANYQTTLDLAEAVKQKERALWGRDPHSPWDPNVPKLRVSDNELQQIYDLGVTHGVRFQPALKYDAEAALNNLRGLFAQRRIEIHERCKQLTYQLKVGIWNKQRTDYERLPKAGHLDGIDALKYLARHIDYQANPAPKVGYVPDRVFVSPDLREEQSTSVHAMRKLLGGSASGR